VKKEINPVFLFHSLISKHSLHCLNAILCAIVLVPLSGCITFWPRTNTQYQSTLGKVAVIASAQKPVIITFKNLFSGNGAATGAGEMVEGCMIESIKCGPFFPLCAPLCSVVMAPAGAVIGAMKEPGSKDVLEAEANMPKDLDARITQALLRDQVMAAAISNGASLSPVSAESAQSTAKLRDYRSLAADGIDTVLEVGLSEVGFGKTRNHADLNTPLILSMRAHVRLIRTSDNTVIITANYVYNSEGLKPSEWIANQAGLLLHTLQVGYQNLGSNIYDNTFLLYSFPYRDIDFNFDNGEGDLVSDQAFGLAPLYQRGSYQHTTLGAIVVEFKPKSLRPTLRWQSFPRKTDIDEAPEEMVVGRVKNVRYDLIIARGDIYEVIYRREGLPDTIHTVETSLSPDTLYRWSVRARFEFDGRERVTEWSSSYLQDDKILGSEQDAMPFMGSYSFRTPK
jgi:hypothetical protein